MRVQCKGSPQAPCSPQMVNVTSGQSKDIKRGGYAYFIFAESLDLWSVGTIRRVVYAPR